jgi:hypothetical protein
VDNQYQFLYDYFLECADDDEIQKFYAYPFMNLLQYVRDQQRYYEKLKIEASKQALIAEKITEQQIIEDPISAKKDIEEQLYDTDSKVTVPAGGPLCAKIVIEDEDIREVLVPAGGPLCAKRVIPDTTEEGLRELREINTEKNAEENQKINAEEQHAQYADTAQVLSEEQLSFTSGGTTSLDQSSTITSSLSSGGTPLISPLINPTSTTGGTTSAASSADNPSVHRFHFCMPLLLPRTGIGVPVSSPPPTASTSSTGVYALASQASSRNVADNPDNPDLGFDTSGTTPDNPRKPAPDLWAYVASRG